MAQVKLVSVERGSLRAQDAQAQEERRVSWEHILVEVVRARAHMVDRVEVVFRQHALPSTACP